MKIKITKLDRLFSTYIRTRDKWTCQRCQTQYKPPTMALHCSHFHGRGKKSVRFDPFNAAALCYGCHMRFTAHPVEHYEWFKKRIGERDFDLLNVRANTLGRPDYTLIEIALKHLLRELDGTQWPVYGAKQ